MAAKRKISVRKIIQVVLTVIVTTSCVMLMASASKIENAKLIKNVVVHYNNCKKYHSVEEKDIMNLAVYNRNIDIWHEPISKLDIRSMEQMIMADPWIANAQVFVDNARVLHMYVTQRIPVARVFQADSRSYYMDTTMSIMPLSKNYNYYTPVFTNVPELKNDSISWALRSDIVSMVRTIQADSFWSAQISQVIVDSPGMYEIVPVLGDQRIIIGNVADLKQKLNNLFVFYKNVLNRIGWDRYQVLDARFNGQVVASPSLPYTGPVDKAVTNMNWINSIFETEARNDSRDSLMGSGNKTVQACDDKKQTDKAVKIDNKKKQTK